MLGQLEPQGVLETLVLLEQQARPVLLAQVQLVPQALQAVQALGVLPVQKVQRDRLETLERLALVRLERLVLQETQETWARVVPPEVLVPQALVPQVPPEILALKETLALLVQPARQVQLVTQGQ